MSNRDLGLLIGDLLEQVEEGKGTSEIHYRIGMATGELWIRLDRNGYGRDPR